MADQLYDPEQYLFRADGTYSKADGSTGRLVTVSDPTGQLNALNGLGGKGYADVPEDFAKSAGLTVTGTRGQDPNYDSGGDFGDILQMVAPIALSYFGAPWLAAAFGGGAAASAAAGAIIGGSSSLITGGDPLKGALMGGAGGLLGNVMGGADAAEGFSSFDSADAMGPGSVAGGVPVDVNAAVGTAANAGDLVNAADVSGTPTGGEDFLNTAQSTDPFAAPTGTQVAQTTGTTATDYAPGSGDAGLVNTAAPDTYQNSFDDGSMQSLVDAGPKGFNTGNETLDSILNWAADHEKISGSLLSGGLQVAGGIGSALLNSSNVDRQIQAAKDLTSQKTKEQLDIEAGKKAAIQAGSYFDANVPIRPSGQPLRRPDGSLVYRNGLIARAQP